MITHNQIYNNVCTKVLESYPTAYCAGKFEPVPSSFPAVFIRQIGNFSNPQNVTFSGVQGVNTTTYEVQIQSNRTDNPMEEANAILDVINIAMFNMFFILSTTNVLEEGENGIYRLKATYRRVIGSSDTIADVPTPNNRSEST